MDNNSNNSHHDLTSKGLEDSQHVAGSPRVLVNQLKGILARNKKEAKEDEKKQTELIKSLRNEIAALEQLIKRLNDRIPELQKDIENKHDKIGKIAIEREEKLDEISNQISEKNGEIDRFIKSIKDFTSYVEEKETSEQIPEGGAPAVEKNSRHDKPNKFAFKVIFTIWIMLTGSLFFFYSSTLYSVFLRDVNQETRLEGRFEGEIVVPSTSQKIIAVINLDYFGKIWEKADIDNPSTILTSLTETLFIIFFPSLVVASGALIFIFKKFKWKVVWLSLAYTLTFVFDVYLAYHIVKRIYEAYYILAERAPELYPLNTKPWELSMALDNTFGLILMIGFVGYVVWGILFDRIVSTKDRFEPLNNQIVALQREIEFLHSQKENIERSKHRQIEDESSRIGVINDEIIKTQEKIIENEFAKTRKQKEIESINNKIFINIGKLEFEVFSYVFGWVKHLSTKSETKERARLIEDCIEMRDEFLATLNTATKFMEMEAE
jgi:hypothetical protein